ncbi:MAG: T9SS type A sorting domain-containing protein, partial [Flavobacteriales bacterium]
DYNANLEYIQQDFESNRLFYIYDRIENELANNRQISAEHWYNVTGDLKLNKDDRLEYDSYFDWINIGLSDTDWLDAENIPVSTKNTLKTMAENHWFQIHGQRAMSWLNHIDGGSLYIPPAKESTNRSFTRSSDSQWNRAEDLRVYPNPSNNNLYFYGTKVEKAHTLVLMNELGQVVKEQALNSSYGYINTSELSNGVYVLVFKGDNELTTEKFIVQH